jgi:hypothetical protein
MAMAWCCSTARVCLRARAQNAQQCIPHKVRGTGRDLGRICRIRIYDVCYQTVLADGAGTTSTKHPVEEVEQRAAQRNTQWPVEVVEQRAATAPSGGRRYLARAARAGGRAEGSAALAWPDPAQAHRVPCVCV